MTAEWVSTTLGSACSVEKSQGLHQGLPYVGLEDIESSTGRHIGPLEEREVKSSTFRFTPKHVLYGRLRPYLNKVLCPDFEGHCSTEIFPLRPSPILDREFLWYWLMAEDTVALIDQTTRGARMPRAGREELLSMKIPVPPLPEQRRIVGALSKALEQVGVARLAAEVMQSRAQDLFAIHRDSLFSEPSKGWRKAPLSSLCDIKHGFAFEGRHFAKEGAYVLLTPGNFYEAGGYRDREDKQKYYTGEIPDGYILSEGDLLVAMTEQAAGLLGSPLLVPDSGVFLHNQRLGLVVPKPDVPWLSEFFFHAFNTSRVRAEIHATASGAKVRHTSPSKIGSVLVAFPPTISEQRDVSNVLGQLHDETARLGLVCQQKLLALEELRGALFRQALSGRL